MAEELRLRRWDVELRCSGFWGFGGGYAHALGYEYAANASYCNTCPMSSRCWEKHRQRTRKLFPALTALFDDMAGKLSGPELVKAWIDQHGVADPYTTVALWNSEDGALVAQGQEPLERGTASLTWPLPVE